MEVGTNPICPIIICPVVAIILLLQASAFMGFAVAVAQELFGIDFGIINPWAVFSWIISWLIIHIIAT